MKALVLLAVFAASAQAGEVITHPVMKSPFGLHYLRTERTLALIASHSPHWIWMCGYEVNGVPVYVSANIVCPVTLEETGINRK